MYSVSRKIRELSRGFTGDRALAGERYLSDPGLLGAYLLHFWLISFWQVSLCLALMRERGIARGVRTALDVGAGPGPASLALLEAGAQHVTAVDRSRPALALAAQIAAERGHALSTREGDARSPRGMPEGAFDLITVAHALNELWPGHQDRIALRASLVERLAGRLAPGGRILIIEPALMQTAQECIRVRDALVRGGFVVDMPCIWQADCPALPRGTCHGEFDWTPPPEMVRLSHMARIGREKLKMAWFVLRPGPALSRREQPESPEEGIYRVVSEPLLSKGGRIRYLVCGPLGRFALSAPKACPAPGVRPFYGLRRGEGIRIHGAARRESGWGLDAGSRVDIVEHLPRAR
jgi:protein-L-isoaspartate O-methyltransferase